MVQQNQVAKEYLLPYADRSSSESTNFDDGLRLTKSSRTIRNLSCGRVSPWYLHIALAMAYTTVFIVAFRHTITHNSVFGLVDSPAKYVGEHAHLEVFPIQGPPHGIYTGKPRPELDQAWKDLLRYNNIRVSEEWVKRFGREDEAVHLPDGGYLGMLSVFHELHCIKRLQQTLFPDHYFPNATDEEVNVNLEHNLHCLEVLRMSATCRGDVSIITHMWTDVNALPIVNQNAPHQCIDFSKIMDYSRDNSVDVYQENYIIHPKFGPSFPHRHSIKPLKSNTRVEIIK